MIRETIIFVTLGLAIAVAWHHLWVQPHDQFVFAVMDCMTEKNLHDQQGYNICADQVREELNNIR